MISLRYLPHEFQSELGRMRSQLDELFAGRTGAWPTLDPTGYPPVNAWEDGNAFYVEAELPGLSQEDLEITLPDATTLSIKGARKEPTLEGAKWQRRERAFGSFERTIGLPGAVDAENVEATSKLGVLTIKLPKAPELRPRKIEVKAS
jgi:HSP20 family protein